MPDKVTKRETDREREREREQTLLNALVLED